MSAGYIQLAAIGQQDAYLTGSPQVTYFSGVYKRHTPFVLEAYDIPFIDKSVLFGQTNRCRIPPKGDLIRALTLKMDLPALTNPGNNWTWLEPSAVNYLPHVLINGYSNVVPLRANVSYYSTINVNDWLVGTISTYISYSSVSNKFTFKNCANVEVDETFGVFWGLDPKLGAAHNANLIYTVGTSSNLTSNSSSNILSNVTVVGTRPADFTLEQSGWLQISGIVNTKTGLFLQKLRSITTAEKFTVEDGVPAYLDFASSKGWENYYPKETAFKITDGGRVQFFGAGLFLMRAGIILDAGSLASISYGSDDGDPDGKPTAPLFEYTYTCRVSPDPSMPVYLPISIPETANTYYFFITTASGAQELLPGSFLSVSPIEEAFKLNKNVALTGQYSRVQIYGNTSTATNAFTLLEPDSTFTFFTGGMYLFTGIIYLDNPAAGQYVANVAIGGYTYDMALQGRDPTFTFSIPLVVTSTTDVYAINVGMVTTTSAVLDANTFFAIHQFGVTPDLEAGVILPRNGVLFKPNVTDLNLNSNIDFSSNFTSTSNSTLISVTGNTSLQFANTGVYMMTAVVCGQDPISSLTFGNTTYPVGVGLLPPYTFSVPTIIDTPLQTANISFRTTNPGSQNVFSNTFITVYPLASNTLASGLFNYYDSVGTWAIKSAELKIGGQSVQTLSGEYIELWNDLNIPYENQPGLTLLTGRNDTSNIVPPGRTYYTNLPFYFYGNPELSIPIVALERQDVEVHVTFRNFKELTAVTIGGVQTLTATILVEYVYLSEPEINWFKSHRLDYLITQCQYQTFDLLSNFTNSIFQLKLINPVRELFFVIQPISNSNYDYKNNGLQSLALTFNGTEAFTGDTTDTLYLNSLQPFIHYTNYPSRDFYMYPFATVTGTGKPFGQINMSRIRQILLEVKTTAYEDPKQLRITAINYNVLRVENGLAGVMFNSGTVSI